MNPYSTLVAFHVVVAICSIGPLFALVLLTKRPPLPDGAPRPMPPEPALRAFGRLLRFAQLGLILMVLSGGVLLGMAHGAFTSSVWLVTSVILVTALGALSGVAQKTLGRAARPGGTIDHVNRTHNYLKVMCLMIVAIIWLMQAKPF
jgi:uncharacterized membrane protein